MIQPSDLTIIILHFNTPDWVEKCLSSLKKHVIEKTTLSIDVVVADNGSDENFLKEVEQLLSHFSFAHLLKIGQNLGFSRGNNVALQKVKSRYVMLLNSDTEAIENTHLDKMVTYMDEHTDVAVVTPRLELSDGQLDWASHRGEPTPWASFTYFTGLEKVFPKISFFSQYHQMYQNLDTIHQIDACSGAAMIVRTEAMNKVGYLDERFFMYAEDLDWCKRFREAGYKVVYFPFSVIIHHKYKSGLKHTDKKHARKTSHHFYDTMLQYFDKHYQHKYPRFVRQIIQLFIRLKKGVS